MKPKPFVEMQVVLYVNPTPAILSRIAGQTQRPLFQEAIRGINDGSVKKWAFQNGNEFSFQYPADENTDGTIGLFCPVETRPRSGAQQAKIYGYRKTK